MTGPVDAIVAALDGLILTQEEADRIIAKTRGRTRARVHVDNSPGIEEPTLAIMRANITDPGYAAQAAPLLLAEVDRLKGTR